MNLCSSDGNQGFPVVLDGSISSESDPTFKAIQAEPEIYASFGTSISFPAMQNQIINETQNTRRNIILLPNMRGNSLNYKGGLYSLAHIQVCRKKQSGSWPKGQGDYPAECVFTFMGAEGISTGAPKAIMLIVPLYERERVTYSYNINNLPSLYFGQIVMSSSDRPARPSVQSLGALFDAMNDKGYALFSSCILLRESPSRAITRSILGLYFPSGWVLPTDLIKALGDYTYGNSNTYGEFFIPSVARSGYPVAKVQPTVDQMNTIAGRQQYINDSNNTWSHNGQTYVQIINPIDINFRKRLLFVNKGLTGIGEMNTLSANRLKTTSEYKCLPLDRALDINGQYVMLDPKTGTRALADTLQGTTDQKMDIEITKNVDASGAIEKFAIVAGSIIAFIVVILAFSLIVRYLLSRNRQGLSAGNPASVELAPVSTK